MAKLQVQVTTYGEAPTYHHLLAGFILLGRAGIIDLSLHPRPDLSGNHPTPSIIEAFIDNRIKIAYDVEDGYIIDWDMRNRYLENVALCFRRSYNDAYHASSPFADKFRPLGLIYDVTVRHPFLRWRRMPPKLYARTLAKRVLGREVTPYWWRFEGAPRVATRPTVLFAARLWDPRGEKGERAEDLAGPLADRESINEMRANCVRILRKQLGASFVGGLVPTDFARVAYPDCLAEPGITHRRQFLRLVQEADVCVATRGLWGSNGYKLGEYVAASRAIVSESLIYSVPGEFCDKRNYLTFERPEECAQQVEELLADPSRIYSIQANNYRYYHEYVRPDRMVLNTITTALQEVP